MRKRIRSHQVRRKIQKRMTKNKRSLMRKRGSLVIK
jgi:hypothetical protein